MYDVTKVRQKADVSFFKVKVSLSTHGRGQKNVRGFSTRSIVIYETTPCLNSEFHRPEKQAPIFSLVTGYCHSVKVLHSVFAQNVCRSPDVRPFMCKYVVLCNRVT
jgi:hypothetical protein